MPIYSMKCQKCGREEEHYLSIQERNDPQPCSCGGTQVREGLESHTIGKSSYQPGVILGSGEKISGHFKDAPKKGGWRRP